MSDRTCQKALQMERQKDNYAVLNGTDLSLDYASAQTQHMLMLTVYYHKYFVNLEFRVAILTSTEKHSRRDK